MGELKQAKDYHQRALEIRLRALGPTHVDVVGLGKNLRTANQNIDNLEQVEDDH